MDRHEGGVQEVQNMSIVSLVSGGIDSLVMYKVLDGLNEEQLPLFVDYGQLSREREWAACRTVFRELGFGEPSRVDLSGYGTTITSGITTRDKAVFEDAFLPGRNLMFLVMGAAFAYQEGATGVAIGLLAEDTHLFPDQTDEFIVNANFAINSALGVSFTLHTPLMSFHKSDTLNLARRYGLPLELTYSCHAGRSTYCGECVSCREILSSIGRDALPQFSAGGK